MRLTLALLLTLFTLQNAAVAQPDRWQQKVSYDMDIDFDVNTHQFSGKQVLAYTNNSPDTLTRVFYHLYLNAFQPNSMMDIRSRTIADPDDRVANRIQMLKADEIGFQKVKSLTQDGAATTFETQETILEVALAQPIYPGQTTKLVMEFDAQVPLQVRRNGRNSREGIAYSMAQWYPKLCEYDYQGWHANPYVAREFYGVWGDFDVTINIDSRFVLGATGYLQNPEEVGCGYNGIEKGSATGAKKSWHFVAPNVHDFVWAADAEYRHIEYKRADGLVLHFLFEPGESTTENWEQLPGIMDKAFDFINARFGQYPYQQYSFLQGGDGGMEYPMATLITGQRPLSSLVGVSVHELMHSWYQMILGSNESLYPWMDEGFTSYSSNEVMNFLRAQSIIPGKPADDPHTGDANRILVMTSRGVLEPLITHADHYTTNTAYWTGAYTKGSMVLYQLQYILGKETLEQAMRRYYATWQFKHPNANDFFRVMEQQSGFELDWFKEYFIHTNMLPEYGITEVAEGEGKSSVVKLGKSSQMPMPVDITVTTVRGDQLHYTIPPAIMRGAKLKEGSTFYRTAPDWPWTNPTYELEVDIPLKRIAKVEIDASQRMMDTNRENNVWEAPED